MLSTVRRFAGPAIAFLVGTGLEVGDIRAPLLAYSLWGLAAVWGMVALATWDPIRLRLRDAFDWVADRSPVIVRSPIVRKPRRAIDSTTLGFLDFELAANRATRRMIKSLTRIVSNTRAVGAYVGKSTPRVQALVTKSTEERVRVSRDVGRRLDKYANGLDRLQVSLRGDIGVMSTSFLKRVEYLEPEGAESIRPTIVGMQEAVANARPSIVGYRNATMDLRARSLQQRVNESADRMVEILGRLVSDFDAVTRFTTDCLTAIDAKVAQTRQVRRATARRRRKTQPTVGEATPADE
ncbi:MAG: hypothetical protein ACRDGD_02425 [Candidatus Limnocylindria bacterium]